MTLVKDHHAVTHGHARSRKNTPTYRSWVAMRERCGNENAPNYARYGGRGIRVCERWESFENFLADMGERADGMTLDRIDNSGNYEPGNVRWATRVEQQRNTRRSKLTVEQVADVVALAARGMHPREIAPMFGVSRNLISQVLRRSHQMRARLAGEM